MSQSIKQAGTISYVQRSETKAINISPKLMKRIQINPIAQAPKQTLGRTVVDIFAFLFITR